MLAYFDCFREKYSLIFLLYVLTQANEKYIGRNITPKTHTPDFLIGKQEENQGQIDTVIIENSRQAIISQEIFEAVQNLKGNLTNKEININGICF